MTKIALTMVAVTSSEENDRVRFVVVAGHRAGELKAKGEQP
jgi:hypothetical protein